MRFDKNIIPLQHTPKNQAHNLEQETSKYTVTCKTTQKHIPYGWKV